MRQSPATSGWPQALGLLIAFLPSLGCEFKGDQLEQSSRPENDPPDHWQIKPVRARIYPSTRFTQRADRTILVARIELFDEMGDSVKGVGRFHFELSGGPGQGGSTRLKRLYKWQVTALTLQQQQLYYEPISRGYLFQLDLQDKWTPKSRAELRVMYIAPDGKRLETQAVLGTKLRDTKLPVHRKPMPETLIKPDRNPEPVEPR